MFANPEGNPWGNDGPWGGKPESQEDQLVRVSRDLNDLCQRIADCVKRRHGTPSEINWFGVKAKSISHTPQQLEAAGYVISEFLYFPVTPVGSPPSLEACKLARDVLEIAVLALENGLSYREAKSWMVLATTKATFREVLLGLVAESAYMPKTDVANVAARLDGGFYALGFSAN